MKPERTISRRFFVAGGAAAGVGGLAWLLTAPEPAVAQRFPVQLTPEAWRKRLTPAQYEVLRGRGTERAGSSPLNKEHRAGVFQCAGCALPVFRSQDKFESGTGWPSFIRPISGAVGTQPDRSWFVVRTEVHCRRCGGHLGHVFDDGPPPTGKRWCMNGIAMRFAPARA